MSELIHNSAGRQNIQKASVMVHFKRILDQVPPSPFPPAMRARVGCTLPGTEPEAELVAGKTCGALSVRVSHALLDLPMPCLFPVTTRSWSKDRQKHAETPQLNARINAMQTSNESPAFVILASGRKHEAAVPLDTQEGEGFEEVEGSGLVVGRVAHRSNQSDYYIDGRKRQQKDVVARLLQEGIDLDNNRFLILQAGALSPGQLAADALRMLHHSARAASC